MLFSRMQTIRIRETEHRGETVWVFEFLYDKMLSDRLRAYAPTRWSFSLRAWTIRKQRCNWDELSMHFAGIALLVAEGTISERILENDHLIPFRNWLEQRRYGARTIDTYLDLVKVFLRFCSGIPEEEIRVSDVERFNSEYILRKGLSVSYQRQFVGALKLYFGRLESSKLDIGGLERPRRERKLPVVLSKEEVIRILVSIPNAKHRLLIALLYGSGLRMGELLKLRVEDIDGNRLMIRVRQGKGKKDRYVTLSERLLQMLRAYWLRFKPDGILFPGQGKEEYSSTSVRVILKRACDAARIKKHVTPHTLRHSYATHLLEDGIDIRYVQSLLGHSKPETTMIYTHVTQRKLATIRSPFDSLFGDKLDSSGGNNPFLIP